METPQIAPSTPAPGSKAPSPSGSASDAGTALPWTAAFAAALTQHEESATPPDLLLVGANGLSTLVPTLDDAGEASTTDDLAATGTDTASGMLPLLQLLQDTAPALPLAAAQLAPAAAAARTADAGDLSAVSSPDTGVTSELQNTLAHGHNSMRVAADAYLPAAGSAKTGAAVSSTDALMRFSESAGNRDSARLEGISQPQFAPALAMAASAGATAAAPPPAQLQINAAVGSAGWGPEFGQKIVWMVGEKQHIAEIHLNPPELGPVDIKLTVTAQETTAVFTSPHSAVREAMEASLPRLREILAESGVLLGNASVTSDSPRDGGTYASQQEAARRSLGGNAGTPEAPAAAPLQQPATRRIGMVDLFA